MTIALFATSAAMLLAARFLWVYHFDKAATVATTLGLFMLLFSFMQVMP